MEDGYCAAAGERGACCFQEVRKGGGGFEFMTFSFFFFCTNMYVLSVSVRTQLMLFRSFVLLSLKSSLVYLAS